MVRHEPLPDRHYRSPIPHLASCPHCKSRPSIVHSCRTSSSTALECQSHSAALPSTPKISKIIFVQHHSVELESQPARQFGIGRHLFVIDVSLLDKFMTCSRNSFAALHSPSYKLNERATSHLRSPTNRTGQTSSRWYVKSAIMSSPFRSCFRWTYPSPSAHSLPFPTRRCPGMNRLAGGFRRQTPLN